MLKELLGKLRSARGNLEGIIKKENLSFYHVFVFLTSRRGRRFILRMLNLGIDFILLKLFGIKTRKNKEYENWRKRNTPSIQQLEEFKSQAAQFNYKPLISIVVPVYNPPIEYLKATIESVKKQVYSNWELCLSDDNSPNKEVRSIIQDYAKNDPRIKYVFRAVNGHISENSNSALSICTGEFIAFLDHDDCLTEEALFENVQLLNEDNRIDLIYSDEDKFDETGRYFDARFKPDWCPDSFLSQNYICHFVVARHSLVKQAGGFRKGFEGSQDYDFLLRITELTPRIRHIAKILYHWRSHSESVAQNKFSKPYAFTAGLHALQESIERRGRPGTVSMIGNLSGLYSVRYDIKVCKKVSVLIPSRNKAELCSVLLDSLFQITNYPDFEVVLIDNNSDAADFKALITKWLQAEPARFRYLRDEDEFNFSRLINNGARFATGEFLLLLNNDMKVIDADWMHAMVEQAQFSTTGAVGAKLIFANERIQHAGMIVGQKNELSRHPFVGYDKDYPGDFSAVITINNYSSVTGACLMVQKSAFEQVGGMDENLPEDFNDLDLCLKLLELGRRNIYLPHVVLFHYESMSRSHPKKSKKSHTVYKNSYAIMAKRWKKYMEHDSCCSTHLHYEGNAFTIID